MQSVMQTKATVNSINFNKNGNTQLKFEFEYEYLRDNHLRVHQYDLCKENEKDYCEKCCGKRFR